MAKGFYQKQNEYLLSVLRNRGLKISYNIHRYPHHTKDSYQVHVNGFLFIDCVPDTKSLYHLLVGMQTYKEAESLSGRD